MALVLQELSWILKHMKELKVQINIINVFCDNQGTMRIMKNLTSSGKTKHLDLKLQYIKHEVREDERINIQYVRIDLNLADDLTKALRKKPFPGLREA